MLPRRELMVQTPHQMNYIARQLVKLGYKYIIGWKDVRGYGLMASERAAWQDATSYPHVDTRLS
jgi:hypothetical protein